ncbi:hypothetical protein THOG11_60206 [Vibrio harveyi]|nr:hypothetical protein TH15OA1_430084 [Vibrio harveyi]CAH1574874.1 hypothetical protein THOD03_50206 [Vibrio harveyi]CAH1584168.1 hypothetical protein THOG11_60206 [Vibrio harveyi]
MQSPYLCPSNIKPFETAGLAVSVYEIDKALSYTLLLASHSLDIGKTYNR